jgi:hypothetical protein
VPGVGKSSVIATQVIDVKSHRSKVRLHLQSLLQKPYQKLLLTVTVAVLALASWVRQQK